MGYGRRAFMALLLAGSVGLAGWILFLAARSGHLSGQVFFTLLPFLMLAGIAWRALRGERD